MDILKKLINLAISIIALMIFLFLGLWILILAALGIIIYAANRAGILKKIRGSYKKSSKYIKRYMNKIKGLDEVKVIRRD